MLGAPEGQTESLVKILPLKKMNKDKIFIAEQALVTSSAVFNEDCMLTMKRYPDKFFNLAIVDPPYGIEDKLTRTDSAKNKYKSVTINKSKEFNHMPTAEYFAELFRVSKNQIIWGGNYFELPVCRGFIIWDKQTGIENISQCEFAWTSFDMPAKIFRLNNQGFAMEKKIHPTQKPTKLYDWLLSKFAKEGDLILDTHLGGGSIRISCHKGGFELIASEIDEKYFTEQEARFKNFLKQKTLW